MKRSLICLLLVILLLTIASQSEAKKVFLKWGASGSRTELYANTNAIAALVNKAYPSELEITVVETGGEIENLQRMKKRSVHIASTDAAAAHAAYEGMIDYKGSPMKGIRSLWGGYMMPVHIITDKASGVDKLSKINKLPLAINPGTASGRLVEMFFDANEIKPVYKIMVAGATIDAFRAEVVKGWHRSGFKDASIIELESFIVINTIPVTKEQIEKTNTKYPNQALGMLIPAGLFKALSKEHYSLAYRVSDFISKDVPDDVVYKIVKAVYNERNNLAISMLPLKEGKFVDMYGNAERHINVPLHPGAVRFYEEVLKVKVPERLLPPEMKK